MTIQELIETLEAIRDAHELDTELPVLLAFQPNWPLAFEVHEIHCASVGDGNTVWIAASDRHPESPYAPGEIYE